MRRSAYLLPLVLVFVLACQKQQTTTAQPQQTQPSSFKMSLTTDPVPPVEEQDTTFKLTLTDSSGQPVPGARVTAALKMRTMDMGKNEVTFADKGSGNYEGKGKFTMAGPWDVVVSANQAGSADQQTFSIVAHRKS